MTQRTTTGLLVTLLAVGVFSARTLAQPPATGAIKRMPTEWAIAPKGTVLPEGTVVPEGSVVSPGGAVVSRPHATAEAVTAPESSQGIPYTSGGVGVSERDELARVKSQYNLRLLFAVRGSGEYLSNVQVQIDEVGGQHRLTAVSKGPFFYARLPPGRYTLTLDRAGQVQTRRVTLSARGAVNQSFYWTR
ncbi:carboxypeptidase regulatory-like domain-containing protein [uncultured Thiocystis sp.]|uniref:carboxypeptidase regulatory-like domain-containing protein n=1 Tax=uncultured Thiocystis sp. TaxID=1202134 RepID=UPI0025D8431D|nr:carboxypeptidase regulatory-like domain-containing protein [uncultured Thiocystis sp.]